MSAFDSKAFLATLTELPGVYRMLDAAGQVLYVGKAKNLKKRVSSYFRETVSSARIAHMVAQIASVEITATRTEAEALLLESNLIKSLAPRYNILFRDDKTYPYIVLTRAAYPQLAFFRGNPDRKSDYFGPFPSAWAVRDSMHLLQKMFRLRTCEESVFSNRSRPCLLHQIKRCSAPCVGLISEADYQTDVQMASMFLSGKQQEVISRLTISMESAAEMLAFEQAAKFRDQIQSLHKVQEKQYISSSKNEDVDIVVVVQQSGMSCVNLAMVRGGRHLGDRPLFPSQVGQATPQEILVAFLLQHYAQHPAPGRVLINFLPELEVLEDLGAELGDLISRPLPVSIPRAAAQKAWVEMAVQNATLAIRVRLQSASQQAHRLLALEEILALSEPLVRIECFDISHTQGEATMASCVVYEKDGMKKSDYRRFNIKDIQGGDDYAAMRQAVGRRYEKVLSGESVKPDLLLIDGGKGQVASAYAVMADLGLSDIPIVGVAKGEGRKAGLETLVFPEALKRETLNLPSDHPALHLIQEIRDEAHRFAITGMRSKRAKPRQSSTLDSLPGIGAARRKSLIARFGGLQGVKDATPEQLAEIPGISKALAEKIYTALH